MSNLYHPEFSDSGVKRAIIAPLEPSGEWAVIELVMIATQSSTDPAFLVMLYHTVYNGNLYSIKLQKRPDGQHTLYYEYSRTFHAL